MTTNLTLFINGKARLTRPYDPADVAGIARRLASNMDVIRQAGRVALVTEGADRVAYVMPLTDDCFHASLTRRAADGLPQDFGAGEAQ